MNQEVKDYINLRKKLFILEYAKVCKTVTVACKEFYIPSEQIAVMNFRLDFTGM